MGPRNVTVASVLPMTDGSLQTVQRAQQVGAHRGKRALDLVVGGVGLLLALPLLGVLAVAVALSGRGGVFFVHRRVGRGGREFPMVKFRTLRPGTDQALMAEPTFKDAQFKVQPDDPRITGVGRVLRRTSLDELPQLWNVVRGDMSLVGIRPVVREQLNTRSPHFQQLYTATRPGLTGLWQINGRSHRLPLERVALDEEWIRHWSLWGDIKIILRTPIAVTRPGAH